MAKNKKFFSKRKDFKGQTEDFSKKIEFFVPEDTARILKNFFNVKGEGRNWNYRFTGKFPLNPALLFAKLFPFIKEKKDDKDKYLRLVAEEAEKFQNKTEIVKLLTRRQQELIKKLKTLNFEVEEITAQVEWRLVVGLGASHFHETSMTFHHIYGIPYIPGSAVKGITRHWVILSKFHNNEEEALNDKGEKFPKIFGTQKEQGKVIFMDAYPVEKFKLVLDIMNPHYPDYYSRGEPPADWQTPNPIQFLTVEKGIFKFYLLSKDSKLLTQASDWLKEALEMFGIGAKTSLGYGVFEVLSR